MAVGHRNFVRLRTSSNFVAGPRPGTTGHDTHGDPEGREINNLHLSDNNIFPFFFNAEFSQRDTCHIEIQAYDGRLMP